MSNATDVIRRAIGGQAYRSDDPGEALSHLERCEEAIMRVAVAMAEGGRSEDLTDYVAEVVSLVAPHPGSVLEGRDESGTGPAERYLHDLAEYGFTVYMSDIAEAQGIDDHHLGEREEDN